MWAVASTEEFDEWFAALDGDAQAEVIARIELLKLLGPALGRPHADTLKGSRHANMKELRATARGKVIRIAFAFDRRRAAILLAAGSKTGVSERLFYRRLIERADALFDAHLRRTSTH